MPATEQTWRDLKFMHLVFGLTSLLMLVCTIWMMAADHIREWKKYQLTFRNVEYWTATSRISDQESAEFEAGRAELEQVLAEAGSEIPAEDLIDEFKSVAAERAQDNGYDLDAIDAANADLQASGDADERTARRDRLVVAIDNVVRKARFDEDNRQRNLKFRRAEYDSERSKYEIDIGKERPAEALERQE